MANMKSLVEETDIYVRLVSSLLFDVGALEGIDVEYDVREIARRTQCEGLSFLTKTLPKFFKHCLMCIESGSFIPIAGFQKQRSGPLPLFLGGLVELLFDKSTGDLLQNRVSESLGYIEQICTFLYKCEFPYTNIQMKRRLDSFKAIEEEMVDKIGPRDYMTTTALIIAIDIAQELFKNFSLERAVPRHGPGAVANRERAEEKYKFVFSDRIDSVFPYDEWFIPMGESQLTETVCQVALSGLRGESFFIANSEEDMLRLFLLQDVFVNSENHEEADMRFVARGLFVNKDSRGPRYISAEPKEHMWLQQAIGHSLMEYLQNSKLCKGHLNFSDQSINANLALESSLSRKYATLDMADASDRVSLALVREVLPSRLVRLLEACRSNSALLPDGTVLPFRKFAPMGSACCFPIESVLFYILVTACVVMDTGKDPEAASRKVYVYGDDIIVDVACVPTIIRVLSDLGLVFNKDKSFVQGPFRESCGVDAIDGINITPIKLRHAAPKSKHDSTSLISWLAASDMLFRNGYWRCANELVTHVKKFTRVRYVAPQSGLFGISGYEAAVEVAEAPCGWDRDVHALYFHLNHVKKRTTEWADMLLRTHAPELHSLVKLECTGEMPIQVAGSTTLPVAFSELKLRKRRVVIH
jgi:hypothetical protein